MVLVPSILQYLQYLCTAIAPLTYPIHVNGGILRELSDEVHVIPFLLSTSEQTQLSLVQSNLKPGGHSEVKLTVSIAGETSNDLGLCRKSLRITGLLLSLLEYIE